MLTHGSVFVDIYSSAHSNSIDSNNNKCTVIYVTKSNIDVIIVYA